MTTPASIAAKLTEAQRERAGIAAWLRALANAQLTPPILAFFGDPWGDDGQRLCAELADAIERGAHLETLTPEELGEADDGPF